MGIFLGWIILSFVAGYVGNSRKIGFWSAFLLSIFLSPLVGLIVAFNSDKNVAIKQQLPFAELKLIDDGDKLYQQGKLDDAIVNFTSALSYSDKAPNTNFKLAKLYSLKQDIEKSFKHLVKAIEDGFSDFEKINHDSNLLLLRKSDNFKAFVSNRYKLPTVQSATVRPISRIEELEKLNLLFEKGVLTKDEFENEKKKNLSGAN